MQSKDAQIMSQVAGKIAGDIIANRADITVDQFPVYVKAIGDALLEYAESITTAPTAAVTVPANVFAQAEANLQAAGIATAPAQPSNEEDLWKYFVQHKDEFWDNRGDGDTTISGGNRPDFKAKNLVDAKGKNRALFLVSRRYNKTAPDFVFESLGIPKPNLATAPVPAATAPAPF